MILIALDDEQLELLASAAEMAGVALEARAKRLPPESVLHKSLGLSSKKLAQVLFAASTSRPAAYADLSEQQQKDVSALANILIDPAYKQEAREFAWDQLRNMLIRHVPLKQLDATVVESK